MDVISVCYICVMIKKQIYSFLWIILLFTGSTYAQELNCTVKISTVGVQSDKTIFEAMEKSVTEFINNTKWTNEVFGPEERIDCSIFINVSERVSSNEFKASMQVQSRRPVYNSSYNSTLMLYSDEAITFGYTQFDPLVYTENTYTGELAALLSYYAYLIIGTDYDTFSPLGGTPYYEKAFNVCNLSQNYGKNTGWKAGDDEGNKKRTRFMYISNLLDAFYQPLRECLYIYHREGLDFMYENNVQGTLKITEALQKLEIIHTTKPNTDSVQQFFYAKADELSNLYKAASPEEQSKAVALLRKLNPGNNMKYSRISSVR